MKVCIVVPPTTIPKKSKWGIQVSYPIGLSYVASYLDYMGIETRLIDCVAEGWRQIENTDGLIRIGLSSDQIKTKIKAFSPDIVGIGCTFTPQVGNMYAVADIVKSVDPDIPVVVGGVHPSSQPFETLKHKSIDIVVRGEGEITMYELTEHYSGKRNLEDIRGLCFRQDGENKQTETRGLIKDLDSIPFPAYHLLPMEEYFEAGKQGLSERAYPIDNWASMITSRGCPYQCYFCAPRPFGRSWRGRTPENVLEEIELLVNKYKVKHIFFEDDNLTLDIKRAERIFDLIIERGLDITWGTPNGVRADSLSRSLLEKMKKAGCEMLVLGIESGNQRFMNEVIKKNLNLKKVEESAEMISDVGMPCVAFFIMGLVGENKETVEDTIRLARKLAKKGIVPRFQTAFPLPVTDLYEIAKSRGYLIKDEIELSDWFEVPILFKTEDFSPEDIYRWRRKAIFLTTLDLLLHKPGLIFHSLRQMVRSPGDLLKLIRRI